MQIFISHDWDDMTVADRLARDLEGVGTIWIDLRETKPGERIDDDVLDALRASDLVVVLWSRRAAESAWVTREANLGIELHKTVVPCLLDDAPLPPAWANLVAIPFGDFSQGFARLNLVIYKQQAIDLGILDEALAEKLDTWDGVVNYASNYRSSNEVTGDAAYWIDRILETSASAHEAGTAFLEDGTAGVELMQAYTGRMEAALEDPVELQRISADLERDEARYPDYLKHVRKTLDQIMASFDPPRARSSPPPAIGAPAMGTPASDDPDHPTSQLRSRLKGSVPDDRLAETVEALYHYVESANPVLEAMGRVAQAYESPAGYQVVAHLSRYLHDPNDLVSESQYGYFGYLDDAWLIHNTASFLVTSGLVAASMFPVDWQRIIHTDGLVLQVLPQLVQVQLTGIVMQYAQLVEAEVGAAQAPDRASMAVESAMDAAYIASGIGWS